VRRFSLFERHHTYTEMQISIAFKLTVAKFCNSTFVLLGANVILGNYQSNLWFDNGNLIQDVFVSVILNCYLGTILQIFDIGYIL
jgi:hypothetical protein